MSRYKLTESASDDLREIVAYLAEHAGEDIALRIETNSSENLNRLPPTPARDIAARI